MARFSVCFLLIFYFCATYSFATAAALSLEDKLQELEIKLEANVNNLKTTKSQLEEKVKQLETKLELNNELRNDLIFKVTQLETKNVQLEAKNIQLEVKVQKQENILTSLLKAAELPTSSTGWHTILNNRKTAIGSATGRSAIPRTCREFRAINPSLPSGMQWIDPDGQGVGDGPIYVYCNMTSGSTSIVHDSELPIDVGHCADPGCYSRSINYNASIGQIKTLMELSTECHQSITYGCNFAPFELNGVAYSWWNDREGNAQYFWAGNNTDGIHTCQCGINGNCVDSVVKCNCDTLAPMSLIDHGVITDENLLPVSRLNFGRTQLGTSSGIHTLGRFECTGTVALTQMPTSCEDLWLIGHTLNGFYLVMEGELVKNVYCDFTKSSSDAGFQSLIGYAEVKPKPTYFGMPTSCENLNGAGHTSSGLFSVMEGDLVKSVYCNFTKLSSETGFQSLIGYAEVKPKPTYFGMPTSCANLKGTGHTSSGLFSVMEGDLVKSVYCNFTKLSSETGFQSLIGYAEVKPKPTYFGMPTSCANLKGAGHTSSGLFSVMEGESVKSVYCNFTKLSSETGFQNLIGYAEVKPKPTYFGIPTSCANLKGAGHTSSGLYSVKGAKMIESVYCDFTKPTSDAGFQKWIGYSDVKSAPVHFYVQRSSNFNTTSTPIPFQLARLNEGNAMNLTSGKFTAPRTGVYFFSFTGHAQFSVSSSRVYLYVYLYLNGSIIGIGYVTDSNTFLHQNGPFTLQSTLNLKKGDQVFVKIGGISSGTVLFDDNTHYTHFTGVLLQEEIVASL